MAASIAPPSGNCSRSTLLLQRRHSGQESKRWRTTLRFGREHMPLAEQLVTLAKLIDPEVSWRLLDRAGNVLAEV